MNTGWDQLHCPFFHEICLSTLEDYFHSEGFLRHHADRIGGVVFESGECFLEVSYEAETIPRYSPTLVIGLGSDSYDKELLITGVPFWFLIPSTSDSSKYTFWKFGTEAELATVLNRIKNEVFQIFGSPLWRDTKALKEAVTRFNIEYVGR